MRRIPAIHRQRANLGRPPSEATRRDGGATNRISTAVLVHRFSRELVFNGGNSEIQINRSEDVQ